LDETNEISNLLKDIEVDYYLNGSLQFSKDKYFILCNFVETDTKQINFSVNESFNIEDETFQLAEIISNKIYDFFQIKKLSKSDDKSIHPFKMGTKNISALKAFLLASEHMYRMERVEAKKYLKQSIELDSTFLCPRVWLISYLFSEGNYQEAETNLKIAKRYEHKANIMEKILINWAEARLKDDIFGRIRCLKMGLEYSPQNNIILYQLGFNYYTLKNYSTALKYLEPVVEMKWTFSPAYYVTAFCLLKQSKVERAIKILEGSLVHEPIYEMTYLLLELAYRQIGDFDQTEYYRKLSESHWAALGISEIEGLIYSAELNSEFSLFHESISDYRKVLEHEPNNIHVIEKIGDLHLTVKDTNASIGEYKNALLYDNLIPSVNLKLGELYDARSDTMKALKYYNNFVRKDTSEIKAQIRLRINQLNNQLIGERNVI
jgi:tetratricopeptide (TPR) repeat protein